MGKIVVLIGNYGSGKTEIAVNMAVEGAAEGLRTLVIDLDKVNDYFRMSDRVQLLEDKKISVVTPTLAGKGVTPTSMSAAVASAFTDNWDLAVFDVGGDSAGALSLGRYCRDFDEYPGTVEVYDIVNVFRPMSETPEKIIKLMEQMEGVARRKVTGLVNNSNLLEFSSADDLRRGYDAVREVSVMTGIPVVYTTGRKQPLAEFKKDGRDPAYTGKLLPLQEYVHRSWSSFTNLGF